MVQVETQGVQWHISPILKTVIDYQKERMQKNYDSVIIVDGKEGDGKSKMACQYLYYATNGKFTMQDIVYSTKQYRERMIYHAKNGNKYHGILYDESFRSLSNKKWMTQESVKLIQTLMECRKYNLFHVIVLPSVFELNRYVALHRADCLVHVFYDKERDRRGRFAMYGRNKLKKLYLEGRKKYNYLITYPDAGGHFTNFSPLDWEAYEKHKDEYILKSATEDEEEEKQKTKSFWETMPEDKRTELIKNAREKILDRYRSRQ